MTLPAEQILPSRQGRLAQAPLIVSPSQYLLTGGQFLRLRIWCQALRTWTASQRVFTLATRTIDADGNYQIGSQSVTADPSNNPQTITMGLDVGAIQSAIVSWTGATVTTAPGPAYAIVDFMQGTISGASQVIGTLCGGYVGPGLPLTWPGQPILGPMDGPGYQTVFSTNAPVGNEVSISCGSGLVLRVRAVRALYTADATVASRRPRLLPKLGGVQVGLCSSPQDITAGQTVDTLWMAGAALGVGSALRDGVAPLPAELTLRVGDTIETSTVARQAGDQYGPFSITADCYIETLP